LLRGRQTEAADGWSDVTARLGRRSGIVVAAVIAVAVAGLVSVWSFPGPRYPGAAATLSAEPTPTSSATTASAPATTAEPGSTPALATVAIVPVTSYRAPWDSTDGAEVAAVLAGSNARYAAIELVAGDADLVLPAIGAKRPGATARLVLAADAGALRADMAAHRDRLGFLRAGDVDPSVRALAWEANAMFGVDRVASLAGWPLSIEVPAESSTGAAPGTGATAGAGSSPAYDPAAAWTLVAGGDINLDGAVAYHVKDLGLGVDFPFDGGTAEITARYCCSSRGNLLPRTARTGDAAALRDLLSGADLSIANFENPAPDDFVYHPGGYTFSADPALIEGLANAGIDWVSLANNHIRDAGGSGVIETMRNLDRWGIEHGGAGANLDAARAASFLDAGGSKVAILAYDTIRPPYAAGPDRAGSNQMSVARVTEDVRAARAAGADLVVVFPHWGVEYTATPTAYQRRLAHAAIDAGADLVIGNHPHWAGAVEVYRGQPTFYALGDFVFNIDRSEMTEEGIVLELTFSGSRLVQARMRPFVILDGSQPNLLDPAASGKVVMDQVFGASRGLLRW
jgi:poly-gamma-glutamate capsule biosynthesis protein CapA/YwtB (metallophosphatase superfamily)